jgi:ribosomal protein L16
MLTPKRVKYRKQHRPSLSGRANKGNSVTYGDYGLQAVEAAWITNRQIEAARVAINRYIRRRGNVVDLMEALKASVKLAEKNRQADEAEAEPKKATRGRRKTKTGT